MKSKFILLAPILLATATAPIQAHAKPQSQRFGAWTVTMRFDSFSGENSCKITGSHIEYLPGIVVLKFPQKIDTFHGWYRIDGGESASIDLDLHSKRRRLGFRDSGTLENPSGGEAVFLSELITDSTYVDVKAAGSRKPRRFKVKGLSAALNFAAEQNCKLK